MPNKQFSDTDKCLIFGNTQANFYNKIIISGIYDFRFINYIINCTMVVKNYFYHNTFSDVSNEMKNLLEGNYVEVLKNDVFLSLYNDFESLIKSNLSSNIVKHLCDYLQLHPFE